MSSTETTVSRAAVRDPLADHLITPQNSALIVIDYQQNQFRTVRSMDPELLLENIVSTVKLAKLTLILHVVGSKLAPSKFSVHVKGGSPRPASFHGSKSGTKVSLNGGSYSVSVGSKKGYKAKLAAGCHGTVQPGGSAICKITETKQKKHH